MNDDLSYLSIAEASELIRKKKTSPAELTEACLECIGKLDNSLNAFITVTGEQARTAARLATNAKSRGPLHGIPIALKDIFDVAGVRTTAASPILADNVATADSSVTARLHEAGAIVLGKLNLHQFAFGATGRSSHYGPARNPWDLERITGGSSSGSGAAVGARMLPMAIGTQTGGSNMRPAAYCGVDGIKAT
ncbi:MAG: amidase, partial [Chloroflexota bacterium]